MKIISYSMLQIETLSILWCTIVCAHVFQGRHFQRHQFDKEVIMIIRLNTLEFDYPLKFISAAQTVITSIRTGIYALSKGIMRNWQQNNQSTGFLLMRKCLDRFLNLSYRVTLFKFGGNTLPLMLYVIVPFTKLWNAKPMFMI